MGMFGDVSFVKLRCASPCLCPKIHSLKIMSGGRIWFHGHYYQLYHKWLYIHLLFIFYIFTSWQWCIYLSWIHHSSLTIFFFFLGTSLWNWRKIVLNCSTMAGCSKSSKLWSTLSAILCRGIICSFNNMVQLSSEILYGINFYATIFVQLFLVLIFMHYPYNLFSQNLLNGYCLVMNSFNYWTPVNAILHGLLFDSSCCYCKIRH